MSTTRHLATVARYLTPLLAVTSLAMMTASAQAAETTLTLYTSQPSSDAQQTVDAFEAANPDIDVEWVRDGTTRLMARLRSELEAGVSRPDVLLIADAVTMESLIADDLLQPYQSPERDAFDAQLYHSDGYYYGTKLITTGIVYNNRAAEAPQRWQDLTDEALKGQVTMPSPLYSGAALIHLASLTDNAALGWDYVEALAANDAEAQGGNGGVFKAVASGTKPYGVVVDFLPIREAVKGSPVTFVFPEEGSSAVTEPVAIMKGADDVEAAQRFVDFVLSESGQQLVSEMGYLPARNGIAPPAGFPAREDITLMPLDSERALNEEAAAKARFSELFGD
ncbi:extracellular solute-binding protein [Halomonas marinisediminis]|uniref:Extracellular solute-binding protein n=3 Tax=Halomonadaceae TaxID=28256 RepID=A0A7X5ANC3_9GAMM|nr:extracellular solute-binding protein [Halomonas icarae]TDB04418.1 extracellular solute-binding protein [Halomonas marinisediminis]